MSRKANWKVGVVLGVVVAIMVTSGGFVMASNLGFKLNRSFVTNFATGTSPIGDNWVSFPYNSPYVNVTSLCSQLGLTGTSQVIQVNAANGVVTTSNCLGQPTNYALQTNAGVLIRILAPTPASAIIVGSSNESMAFGTFGNPSTLTGNFGSGTAPIGDNWLSIPYHTTSTDAASVCADLGLNVAPGGLVFHRIASTGSSESRDCVSGGGGFTGPLKLGEAILVRKNNPSGNIVGHLPPHY